MYEDIKVMFSDIWPKLEDTLGGKRLVCVANTTIMVWIITTNQQLKALAQFSMETKQKTNEIQQILPPIKKESDKSN